MQPLIFFDGFCVLCNGFSDFILRRDRSRLFQLAPLQGKTASRMLDKEDVDGLESIVYLDETGIYKRSSAIIRILIRLGWPYKMAAVFFAVPRVIRDRVYDFCAKHRYRVFGTRESCRLPSPNDVGRILD